MTLPLLPTRSQDTQTWLQRAAETINNILTFKFDASRVRTSAEITAGVQVTNPSYKPGDVRRYGAVGDANIGGTVGTSGVDSTSAIQTALNIAGQPVYIPAGNWLFSNLTIPNGQTLIGDGVTQTNLVCKTGSTGVMFTDSGLGAAKTTIRGVSFYGNNCAYTRGFYFGYNVPSTGQFGTYGYIDSVWVRDLPGPNPGVDINCNVGQIGYLVSYNTAGLQLVGTGISANQLECYQPSGFSVGGVTTGCNFGDGRASSLEVEAQATGTVSVLYTGNFSLDNLIISLPGSSSYAGDHLIEIGAAATTWGIKNLKLYFKDNTATLTNQIFKQASGAVYFGGGIQSGGVATHAGEGNYGSASWNAGSQFAVKNAAITGFAVRITNTTGTIQHRIGSPGDSSTAGNFLSTINGPSTTLTTTPTGADASTAFAAGAKIGSANTNYLFFDCNNAQIQADALWIASVTLNSTGTAYSVIPTTLSLNINGVTKNRLALSLQNATSGANVAWATALGTNGWIIDVTVLGFLK